MELIILASIFALSGIARAVMDALRDPENRFRKWFGPRWWGHPDHETYRNKYKDKAYGLTPKFPGSTTFLVFVTDAWHFFQFLELSCWTFGVSFFYVVETYCFRVWYNILLIFLAGKFLHGMFFENFYTYFRGQRFGEAFLKWIGK